MADVLDYGAPDTGHRGEVDLDDEMYQPPTSSRFEDERSVAQHDPWSAPDDTAIDQNNGQTSLDTALRASPNTTRRAQRGPRMYEFPKELAIDAGNARGPVPVPADDELNTPGPSDIEIPPTVPDLIGGAKDIRLCALHLKGPPISKLSTSRVFAYVSHFGAQPLGVEWIDDFSINVVFPDAASARIALEYLCPAVSMGSAPVVPLPSANEVQQAADQQARFHQSAGADDQMQWPHSFIELLLLPRRCHRYPAKLYTAVEKDALSKAEELVALTNQPSQYPDEAPEIYRELEEEDRITYLTREWKGKIKDVKTLQGTVWARYAIESADIKPKKASAYSNWYKEHGKDAGKQVVSKLLDIGAEEERRELFEQQSQRASPAAEQRPSAGPSNGQWGHIRFGASSGTDANGSTTRGRGAGKGRAVMDSLDDTLDNLRGLQDQAQANQTQDLFGRDNGPRRSASPELRRGRGNRQYNASTLDDEMDSYNAGRNSESPPHNRGVGQTFTRHDGSSFSRNGPGGRRAGYSDDVTMDSGSGSGYNSGAGGSGGEGIRVKGRGRRKAPQATESSSSRMAGWADDSAGGGRGTELFPDYRGGGDNGNYQGRGSYRGGRGRGGGRNGSRHGDLLADEEDDDIFRRAGFSGGKWTNKKKRHDNEEEREEPPAFVHDEHIGRANILRKGGHGAGGYASGAPIVPTSSKLASRLAAAHGTGPSQPQGGGQGLDGMSLSERIQLDNNEAAWDQ